jgi:hypothetical protein
MPIEFLLMSWYSSCGLFWKAIGIVLLLFTLWNGFKLIKWAITVCSVYRFQVRCLTHIISSALSYWPRGYAKV